MNRVPITRQGYEKLNIRVKHLIEVERPRTVKDIAEARAHGDLSENAEYHAARERQGLIEAEVRKLESAIALADVIDPAEIREEKVVFGATVTVYDLDEDVEIAYQIVGKEEIDIKRGRISFRSPIARALIGKYEGDEAVVRTPRGQRNLEISAIDYK